MKGSDKQFSRRDNRSSHGGVSSRKKRDRNRQRRSYPLDSERDVRTYSLFSHSNTHTYTHTHNRDGGCQTNHQDVIPESIPVVEEAFKYDSRATRKRGIYLMSNTVVNHHHHVVHTERAIMYILNPHQFKDESLLQYFRIFVER